MLSEQQQRELAELDFARSRLKRQVFLSIFLFSLVTVFWLAYGIIAWTPYSWWLWMIIFFFFLVIFLQAARYRRVVALLNEEEARIRSAANATPGAVLIVSAQPPPMYSVAAGPAPGSEAPPPPYNMAAAYGSAVPYPPPDTTGAAPYPPSTSPAPYAQAPYPMNDTLSNPQPAAPYPSEAQYPPPGAPYPPSAQHPQYPQGTPYPPPSGTASPPPPQNVASYAPATPSLSADNLAPTPAYSPGVDPADAFVDSLRSKLNATPNPADQLAVLRTELNPATCPPLKSAHAQRIVQSIMDSDTQAQAAIMLAANVVDRDQYGSLVIDTCFFDPTVRNALRSATGIN